MRDLDSVAVEAFNDPKKREKLVVKYKPFILKKASEKTGRYITESDDEWSISLIAFCEAIEKYDMQKGSFLTFAALVISRRLADYNDTSRRFEKDIPINPALFSGDIDELEDDTVLALQIREAVSYTNDSSQGLKEEIEAITTIFSTYGFSFMDLTDCSPKAEKTKKSCAAAIRYILKTPLLVSGVKITKQLPTKIIEKNTCLPRKILERHRKYIIAAVEILSGEYPHLAEYLRFVSEGADAI